MSEGGRQGEREGKQERLILAGHKRRKSNVIKKEGKERRKANKVKGMDDGDERQRKKLK